LAAARVPSRSLCKLGLPRPLFGSTTAVLSGNLETKSADLLYQTSSFSELKLQGDECSSPIRGVSPAPCSTVFCPAAPICGASEQKPSSESSIVELSLCSKFMSVLSILVSRVREHYKVHQVEPLYLVRLYYPWEVAWYPRRCRLRQTHPLPFIP